MALTCGLEIHQQLATAKLFCPCASTLAQEKPTTVVRRQLRAVAGELGQVDVAAAAAAAQQRTFAYHAFAGESCEVELDEEPPQELNPDALDVALQLALLLKCWIPPEVHVMRKTVLDGSNTTGFQRTAVVGLNGTLETPHGPVTIPTVCLEEESCQILKKRADTIEYGLNRLGIPLIEIATGPDIHDPDHAREAAEAIGALLRSTGKVRRGIGTIRQDVNVSIPRGSRVEIKGFQELGQIPAVIKKEMERQQQLLKEGKPVPKEVRKAEPDGSTSFLRPMPGAARMYPETDVPPVPITPDHLGRLRASLPKPISARLAELAPYKLDANIAKNLAGSELLPIFTIATKETNLKPAFIADILIGSPREIVRIDKNADPNRITPQDYQMVFKAIDSGTLPKEAVIPALVTRAQGKPLELEAAPALDVRALATRVLKAHPEVRQQRNPAQALMGLVMKEARGKVSGAEVMKAVNQALAS